MTIRHFVSSLTFSAGYSVVLITRPAFASTYFIPSSIIAAKMILEFDGFSGLSFFAEIAAKSSKVRELHGANGNCGYLSDVILLYIRIHLPYCKLRHQNIKFIKSKKLFVFVFFLCGCIFFLYKSMVFFIIF